ncbi:MAG: anti-sigma factor antagonist [Clostridia bacterium]|nr:anti-sigma factor antagonist [Clostridia bacterium]
MEVKYSVDKNNLYVYLFGELDEYSARESKNTLDKLIDVHSGVNNVVFNFSHLSFMDSTGIGVLIGRYKKLKRLGMPSYIQSPSVSVNKILQISGLYEIMPKI